MERPFTRTQSYMSKWALTYQKKIQRRNYLIKNLIFLNKDIFEDGENLNKLYMKHKEQLFIKFVVRYLETMNEYCLECDSKNIKEVINKIKLIFSLDHVMRRKYKQLYEKIMEIKITEQRLFSKERLEGKKGEEFLQSVKQYLFRNGNNEYMNFDIYYKMIEEMKQ